MKLCWKGKDTFSPLRGDDMDTVLVCRGDSISLSRTCRIPISVLYLELPRNFFTIMTLRHNTGSYEIHLVLHAVQNQQTVTNLPPPPSGSFGYFVIPQNAHLKTSSNHRAFYRDCALRRYSGLCRVVLHHSSQYETLGVCANALRSGWDPFRAQ